MHRLAVLILIGLLAHGAMAEKGEGLDPIGKGKGTWREESPDDADAWQEGKVRIPDYPKDKNLQAVDIEVPDFPYRYLVDKESLTVGKKDNVVRYSVVIESATGVRNVYYEGVRCRSGTYKTYAFGTTDGRLRPTKSRGWRPMQESGVFGYRTQLAEKYLCNNLGYPYELKEMMANLKAAGELEFDDEDSSWAYPGYQ